MAWKWDFGPGGLLTGPAEEVLSLRIPAREPTLAPVRKAHAVVNGQEEFLPEGPRAAASAARRRQASVSTCCPPQSPVLGSACQTGTGARRRPPGGSISRGRERQGEHSGAPGAVFLRNLNTAKRGRVQTSPHRGWQEKGWGTLQGAPAFCPGEFCLRAQLFSTVSTVLWCEKACTSDS